MSISKAEFFVIVSAMDGSVENQVDGFLDRSNSIVFVKRGAVYQMVSTGRRRCYRTSYSFLRKSEIDNYVPLDDGTWVNIEG